LIVSVPVTAVPAVMLEELSEKPVTDAVPTVKLCFAVSEPDPAVSVTGVLVETDFVENVKGTELEPEGTVTLAGTFTTAELDANPTLKPAAGAGPFRVTVPDEERLPTTLFEASESDATCGALTVKVAASLTPPNSAATEDAVFVSTGEGVKLNAADVAPAGTVTDAGTPRELDFDTRVTFKPPEGAFELSSTVPVSWLPPWTLLALSVSLTSLGGSTLRVAEAELVPSVALITGEAAVPTGDVDTMKVADFIPLSIVTVAGTLATASDEERVTTTPLLPAFVARSTVAVAVPPP